MSGYKFERVIHDWLVIHTSHVLQHQRHIKVMLAHCTPRTQRTLNLYAAGSFELSVRSPDGSIASQIMHAGQSSLDVTLPLPAGAIVTERSLLPNALRYCMEPVITGSAWTRTRVDLANGETLQAKPGELLVPMVGNVGTQVSGPGVVFVLRLV